MHARHAVLVGLSYRATMQDCHSNIEQSALLSSVQIISLRAAET